LTRPAQERIRDDAAAPAHIDPVVATALGVLRGLFDRFHSDGIRYCHWKSNQHLHASMIGKTDVDILVDRRAIVPLTRILGESNFKRFVVKPGRGYPGIEDYVGFDAASGTLTHLHVHYQLTLGEKFSKAIGCPGRSCSSPAGSSTPTTDLRRRTESRTGRVDRRAIMKLRGATPSWKPRERYITGGMLRELRWLADRSDRGRLLEVGARLVGERGLAAGHARGLGRRSASCGRLTASPSRAREYRLWSRRRGAADDDTGMEHHLVEAQTLVSRCAHQVDLNSCRRAA
jgi:hypothetical protein